MKSMTTKLMITAAALAIATGVAAAQQYRADIPFAFRAGAKMMAPGNYTIHVSDGGKWITVADTTHANNAILLTHHQSDAPKGAEPVPTLTFVCESSRCALAKVWTGANVPAMSFYQPRSGKDDLVSATEIRLVKMNGD
jgi:hypothetical protein